MRKTLLSVLLLASSASAVRAGDLDIANHVFAAIGSAIFKGAMGAIDVAVTEKINEAIINSPTFSGLSKEDKAKVVREDLTVLLGTGTVPLCYSVCEGNRSTFEQFKTTKLYQALLLEMKEEGTVMNFYNDINRRESLVNLTSRYISRAVNLAKYLDLSAGWLVVQQRRYPVITGTVLAINEILKSEERVMSASLSRTQSLMR